MNRLKNPCLVGCFAALLMLPLASAIAQEGAGEEMQDKAPAEAKEGTSRRGGWIGMLYTVEKIEERLGEKLDDEKRQKIESVREDLKKKLDAMYEKEDYKAAQEELKNAKTKEERVAAAAKVKEATGGFNLTEEYKKALEGTLTEEQIEKAFKRPERKRSDEKPKDEGVE